METNRNAFSPEALGIAMMAATAANHASLFSYPPPTDGVNGFAVHRNCVPQLELDGSGGTLPALTAAQPEQGDGSIWMIRHPSALRMFDEIMRASMGKQIVMFLDYDGTLSPIVDNPDRAFMSNSMRDAVRDVARCFPTAIISGRCRNKVYNFVRLTELFYAGSHGMDIKIPAKGFSLKKSNGKEVIFQPATKFLPMINKVYKILLDKIKLTPGAKVENNKFCLSVHFRCVNEKKWCALADQVKSVVKQYPKLRLTPGRKVLEIRPTIKWDKGKAMEFMLESLGFTNCKDVFPIYIGDDRTDEDAFKVLKDRGQGFGILVSKIPKETSAAYSLQDPSEVMDFLQWLVGWKRHSMKSCLICKFDK